MGPFKTQSNIEGVSIGLFHTVAPPIILSHGKTILSNVHSSAAQAPD